MRIHRLLLVSLTLAVSFAACDSAPPAPKPDPDLGRLVEYMTGSFGSEAQAAEDPDYLDIRLEMATIWPDRTDGHWLYVEQAVASALDRPYRQRVYRVTHVGADLYESKVYELPDPMTRAGAFREEAPLADLTPADLIVRVGAEIILRKIDDGFAGSTLGRLCKSDFRGATYATSEVTITDGLLESWDRGFDDNGVHVWGAEKGAYRFVRR